MIINDVNSLPQLVLGHKPILIMLPFAGGNSYSYRGIIESLEKTYDILCPELPGRGCLTNMSPKKDMQELVKFLFSTWIESLNLTRPYILFGHSMGALTVYLLLQHIKKNHMSLPLHVVVSGSAAPTVKKDLQLAQLPSSEFWDKLSAKGGLSDEILSCDELKEYFEPIIRADIEALENYSYDYFDPLDVKLSVLYGSTEGLSKESLVLWNDTTTQTTNIIEVPGNHFFIFQETPWLISYLKNIPDEILQHA